jgi:phage tail sheath protein FI
MVSYQAPGVYIEEIPSGSRPIELAGTAVAAFVGFTEKGPVGTPVRVTNWTQYQDTFGGFIRNGYTPLSVYGFFLNGGGNCYVVRVGGDAVSQPATLALPGAGAPQDSLKFTSKLEGSEGNDIRIEIQTEGGAPAAEAEGDGDGEEEGGGAGGGEEGGGRFRLNISVPGQPTESFENLTLRRGDDRYVVDVVNATETGSIFVEVEDLAPRGVSIANRVPEAGESQLAEGSETLTALAPADFQGDVSARQGIDGLQVADDVTMICIPDLMKAYEDGLLDAEGVVAVQKAVLAHCQTMEDRVAILDMLPGLDAAGAEAWRAQANLVSDGGYGTLYYPWIKVDDPASNQTRFVPPSGYVAGVWARTDTNRGVWKAPANEEVMGPIDVESHLTQTERGVLNVQSVNVIRSIPGGGIRIWGSRTLAGAASEWRYVPVRRLFNMVKKSIEGGTQWVPFEPNDQALWAKVRRDITAVLTRLWAQGAFFGATANEAFYVKCDAETNPQEVIDAGIMVCEVGIAPVKPAEFVVFRIRQITPGAEE